MVALPLSAQKRHRNGDRAQWHREIREFKLRYLAQEMDLSPDQQQRFVALYDKMQDEKHSVMLEARAAEERLKKIENPTEADYKVASDALSNAREKDAAIDLKYEKQFKTFLSSKQMFKMKEAERKFRDKLREMRRQHKPKKTK